MITRSLAILLLPLLITITPFKKEESIPWSAERRLVWDDFKGKPDGNSGNAALTSSGIEFGYRYGDQTFSFTITCMFDKNKSWGRVKTDYILAHEQGHFDVSEIHARKLYKALKAYKVNQSTLAKDVQAIYSQLMKEQSEMQNVYDDETDNSRNKEKQAAWLKKINKELEQLKDYAGYRQGA